METFLIALILVLNLEEVAHPSASESCTKVVVLDKILCAATLLRKGIKIVEVCQ